MEILANWRTHGLLQGGAAASEPQLTVARTEADPVFQKAKFGGGNLIFKYWQLFNF